MKNVNREIMDARTFYEKTLVSQRCMVNEAIKSAMEWSNPIVQLSTQLYIKIAEELEALGWEENVVDVKETDDGTVGISQIYPVCTCLGCDLPEVTGEHNFVSARQFYEATLQNQYEELYRMLENSILDGFSEIKLTYKSYPVIIDEMKQKGYEHDIWCKDDDDKECSMYYPACGFEEGD